MRLPAMVLAAVICMTVATSPGAASGPPPLTPAQKACAIKKLSKKTFDRLSKSKNWPASALAKIKPCLVSMPKPDPTPTPVPCPSSLDAFFPRTPVDLSLVTSIGPPGQVRGGDYKGHGYFRVTTNDVAVVMPADGTLYEGSRYIESGEVQYLLQFRLRCGLEISFDHVLEPAAKVAGAFAGKPEAKPDDSRTYPLGPVSFALGEQVAASVGIRATGNAFLDFGVYDPSKPNAASQQPGFQGDRTTWKDASALCWYDMFPPADAARIRSLAGVNTSAGATSDICS